MRRTGCLLSSIALLLLFTQDSQCRRTYNYAFPGTYCGGIVRTIDGATLVHSAKKLYTNSACVIKFKADGNFNDNPRFLVNFKNLHIDDCTVRLSLFYERHDQGVPQEVFDCKSRGSSILRTPGRYITLRLDKMSVTGYEFEIIITSFTQPRSCPGFRCWNATECLDKDLQCDRAENCIDGSDEFACKYHRGLLASGLGTIMGMSMAFMTCCIATIVVITLCCRRRKRRSAGQVLTTVHTSKPMNVTSSGAPVYNDYQPADENHYVTSYSAVSSNQGFPLHQVPPSQTGQYANIHQHPHAQTAWPSNARKIPEYV